MKIALFRNKKEIKKTVVSAAGDMCILDCKASEDGNEVLIRVRLPVQRNQLTPSSVVEHCAEIDDMAQRESPLPPLAPDNAGIGDSDSCAGAITGETCNEITQAARDIKQASRRVQDAAERVVNFEDNLIRESQAEAVRYLVGIYEHLYDGYLQLQYNVINVPVDVLFRQVEQVSSSMRAACKQMEHLLEQIYGAELIQSEDGSEYNDYIQVLNDYFVDDLNECPIHMLRPGIRYLGEIILSEKVEKYTID
ncbi:hypothetical protein B1400_1522 [Bifidobacterium italicum]|uniref:Uncharacterized protein n=1 Tax=Bifidobacterium italicum TaxID=1960968 RepID=A0A2A2EF52_9BIFI|nr:hypothetical protein [Bifidobacterium italicum]PAU67839.1 hypothetical protein B1400_1522 [Bifidobacterium italicum]